MQFKAVHNAIKMNMHSKKLILKPNILFSGSSIISRNITKTGIHITSDTRRFVTNAHKKFRILIPINSSDPQKSELHREFHLPLHNRLLRSPLNFFQIDQQY